MRRRQFGPPDGSDFHALKNSRPDRFMSQMEGRQVQPDCEQSVARSDELCELRPRALCPSP